MAVRGVRPSPLMALLRPFLIGRGLSKVEQPAALVLATIFFMAM